MGSNDDIKKMFQEQFAKQPVPIQKAIQSADLEKHMQELAHKHKLLLDQWQVLENQVILALLGFEPVSELAQNIQKELDISHEAAVALADDISAIVFDPIRKELERILEHPEAEEKKETAIEGMTAQVLAQSGVLDDVRAATITPTSPVVDTSSSPAETVQTPPAVATPQTTKATPSPVVTRGSISPTYTPGAASTQRASVEGDPYREPVN